MSKQIQSFNPRLIIVDHFDELINQIDIKTETLIEEREKSIKRRKTEIEGEKNISNKINELRETQIEKIKELKESNLRHSKATEDEFREKWSHVIDDKSLEYKQKIDKIKEELILEDCVLLDNPNFANGLDLWVTSWFHNQKDLEFLR